MKYVIYNIHTGKTLSTPARSAGMFVRDYKSESAAKAALTRIDKKGKLGIEKTWNEERKDYDVDVWEKTDFAVADYDTYREVFPVKMVERKNLMSGKTYMEAENTPGYLSPASEAYWSM
jgi:hypothetical protein